MLRDNDDNEYIEHDIDDTYQPGNDGRYFYGPRQDGERQKKKRGPVFRFFRLVIIMVLVFAAFFVAADYVFAMVFGGDRISGQLAEAIGTGLKPGSRLGVFSGVKPPPERTNFVIFGVDDGGTRTDAIMVGCFNSKAKTIDLISVPRDTYAVIPKERRDILKEQGYYCPADGVMKINAVHHYARDMGVDFAVKQLEELMGISIEFYVKIDLDALKFIVDEIGGVEFDVPQRMYYTDPAQGLYIDLQPGLQTLNGSQAEGLVRYRKADIFNPLSNGYPMSDLTRVEVQQNFVKAVVSQVLNGSDKVAGVSALFSASLKYVKTNVQLSDISAYFSYVKGIGSDDIRVHTMPYGRIDGYVYPDEAALKALADEVFYGKTEIDGHEE